MTYSHAFSRAWHGRHVFASSSDWYIGLFTIVEIGQSNYFGFGFTTLNCASDQHYQNIIKRKPLYNRLQINKSSCFTVKNSVLFCMWFDISYFAIMYIFVASRENHVKFGDCAVGVSRQLSFTLTNHSSSDPVRFTWSPPPEITFSPCTGHLQPNCAKDVTVTFCSKEPKTYSATNIPCKVTKIKLGETQDKVILHCSSKQIQVYFFMYCIGKKKNNNNNEVQY